MNHFQCMEIKDYLHLSNSSGLIARLLLPQGSIPCDLFLFNIREFELKKGFSMNLIFFNPSFALLVLLPYPLFLFFYPSPFFLLYASPSFWRACLTALFFALHITHTHTFFRSFMSCCHTLSFFHSFMSCCHTHFFFRSFMSFCHTHFFFRSFMSFCHTHPSSIFMPHLPSYTFRIYFIQINLCKNTMKMCSLTH
jgi:hypothetical protein